jgi:hypothetical protein
MERVGSSVGMKAQADSTAQMQPRRFNGAVESAMFPNGHQFQYFAIHRLVAQDVDPSKGIRVLIPSGSREPAAGCERKAGVVQAGGAPAQA